VTISTRLSLYLASAFVCFTDGGLSAPASFLVNINIKIALRDKSDRERGRDTSPVRSRYLHWTLVLKLLKSGSFRVIPLFQSSLFITPGLIGVQKHRQATPEVPDSEFIQLRGFNLC